MISIHAPREGGDPLSDIYVTVAQIFQSTPPARGATVTRGCLSSILDISIHAPREGGDSVNLQEDKTWQNFNPRPPRGGRPLELLQVAHGVSISIHAPREGGDHSSRREHIRRGISIHAPREGGDAGSGTTIMAAEQFQSTPPARGATLCIFKQGFFVRISIHAPREGGDKKFQRPSPTFCISIHAPREGGDIIFFCYIFCRAFISIHAPREGGDSKDAQFYLRIFDK